jgi:hypothetical protein
MSANQTLADTQNKWYLTIIKTAHPATETNEHIYLTAR